METLVPHTFLIEQPEAGQDAVPSPAFALAYNSKAITESIAPSLLSISYTDKTDGEADELEVELEDTVGNWRAAWYPEKSARLVARLGWPGELLDCGEFEIDEVAQSGPPSVVSLRGLAAGLSKATRTKRSKGYESQTLRQIAGKIAGAYGMTVTGTIRPITIARATQNQSRDLRFLKKLALDYGHVFSVRGKQLVFTDVYGLEGSKAILSLRQADIVSYSFTDKLTNTYAAAEVSYHNPKTRKVVRGRAAAAPATATAADTLKLHHKAENATQADAQARAALHWHNSRACECTISMPGTPAVVAGVVVRLREEFGRVAGAYYVMTSTHRVTKADGYDTSFTAKRIGE